MNAPEKQASWLWLTPGTYEHMMPCGCVLRRNSEDSEIEMFPCPIHAAAPRLLAIATRLWDWNLSVGGIGGWNHPVWTDLGRLLVELPCRKFI